MRRHKLDVREKGDLIIDTFLSDTELYLGFAYDTCHILETEKNLDIQEIRMALHRLESAIEKRFAASSQQIVMTFNPIQLVRNKTSDSSSDE